MLEFLLFAQLAFALPPLESHYIYEIPKYSPEVVFSKNIRKKLRQQMMHHRCKNVVVGNPYGVSPDKAHPDANFKQVDVKSDNCRLIQAPQQCDGTWRARWLFPGQEGNTSWVVCRRG